MYAQDYLLLTDFSHDAKPSSPHRRLFADTISKSISPIKLLYDRPLSILSITKRLRQPKQTTPPKIHRFPAPIFRTSP